MKHLTHAFSGLNLKTKLALTHLILIIIPMLVVGIFFYTSLYEMIVSDTIRKEQASSTKTVPLVEKAVADIQDADRHLSSLLQNTVAEAVRLPDAAGRTNTLSKMEEELDYLATNQSIAKINIYMSPDTIRRLAQNGISSDYILPMENTRGTYWHGIFAGSPELNELWCPPFYLSSKEIAVYGNMAHITRNVLLTGAQSEEYFIAIYFHRQMLTDLLNNNLSSASNVAYLVNERDNLAASTNYSLSSIYHFDYSNIRENVLNSRIFLDREILGETVYAAFYSISGTDWYMVVAMPASPLEKKSTHIVTGFVLIYMICLVIALLIALMLSNSITKRLSSLIEQMSLVRMGPPAPMPEPETKDEIGDLISSYNYMTGMIDELLGEQARNAEDLRLAEFNSLQAQINPHFLYNTMDMISWLAQKGETDLVTDAVQKLSRFYRLTLSRKSNISTVEQEVEHASIYISLQNMRFSGTIELITDIPDNLYDCAVPKLTLQPIVENCILHGIMEKKEKSGTIVITGWLEDDTVILLVSDDGIGMDDTALKNLFKSDIKKTSGTNIAVYNIHRRLQLLFGSSFGLTYRSAPGEGTEVEIRIPARHNVEEMQEKSIPLYSTGHLIHALHLLSRDDMTIEEIAIRCGYSDVSDLENDFKQYFGRPMEKKI